VPFTLTQDSAAPTGQSITLTGATAPYFGSASVTFNLGDGNDGSGAGLDTTTRTVTRESATLTGDACGTFSPDAGTYSSPDTTVSTGHCYRYSFTIADRVGNVSSATTATAKVDTAAPTVSINPPSALTGAGNQYYDAGTKTLFFRSTGTGSFSLGANASDTNTAVTGVTFPNVSGLAGWTGSTGGTDTSSPYSSPADYTWSAGAAEPGAKAVSATDKAANSGTDTITITDDTTAPTGQSITLTGSISPPRRSRERLGRSQPTTAPASPPTEGPSRAPTTAPRAATATATRSASPTRSATSRRAPSRRRSRRTRRPSPSTRRPRLPAPETSTTTQARRLSSSAPVAPARSR